MGRKEQGSYGARTGQGRRRIRGYRRPGSRRAMWAGGDGKEIADWRVWLDGDGLWVITRLEALRLGGARDGVPHAHGGRTVDEGMLSVLCHTSAVS